MVISGSPRDLDTRFSHLLQPIRDLTKNWDVDIANELDEYLEEIESITITFDGGATTMNFAEAAMVIQGSAGVYSKKVEYLYTLVYQVLDLLANKKRQGQTSSVDGEGNDQDANFPADAEDEFLTLDDTKVNKNITMSHDRETSKGVYSVPRTPMALIPLDDNEKGATPLLSKTGELLGSRNDFKMNTCNIYQTGAMLLDMSHLGLLESSLRTKTSTPLPIVQVLNIIDGISTVNATAVNADEMDQNNCDEGFAQDVSMDDNNDDMLPSEEPANVHQVENNLNDHESLPLDMRRSERNKEHIARIEEKKKMTPVIDHWKPLEAHCCESVNEKALKKGQPFRIPQDLQTNKKKRKKNPLPKPEVPISKFITNEFHSHASKFTKNPLRLPSFLELESCYWAEFRRRQSFQRKERKILVEEGRFEELAEHEQQNESPENEDIYIPATGDDDDDDCDDIPAGGDDDGMSVFPTQLPMTDDLFATTNNKHSLSVGNMNSQNLLVSSYEDLVRHYVEGFLASAQQYAQVTELSTRVSEWEDKIGPKLKEEEYREAFDIHLYGSKVIDHIQSANKTKLPFRHIAAGKSVYEICRLFLATLQLANNYNVEIECEGTLEEAVDKMVVKLLNTKRIYEDLAEYKAPSTN